MGKAERGSPARIVRHVPKHSSLSLTVDNFNSSLSYFISSLDRLFMPDYQPTVQDIFYIQKRTVGITETIFQMGDSKVVLIDAGGCRNERRKWIHYFQDMSNILFMVDLSGYDKCLVEDHDAVCIFIVKLDQDWRLNNKPFTQTQIQHAMIVWDSICHSQLFRQTSMVSCLHVS